MNKVPPEISDLEQEWRRNKIWNAIRSSARKRSRLSRPVRHRLLVLEALSLLGHQSPSLTIDLVGLCYIAGMPRHKETARKFLKKRPFNRLVETSPLQICPSPEKIQETRLSRKGVVCHNAILVASSGYKKRPGKRLLMYRLNPRMSELDQAADLGDMSRFLLRMYADTDFIKGLENVRLRNKDFMERLAGARNRLLELLTEYGLLDREIAQKAWVDVSKVEEQFGQVADAYKTDSISEEQIMREAIFLSRKLSLMPKLLKPTCTNSNCRKVLDRIKLKYEGTATCRCGTTYFGFPCKFCFSPIVAREGQDEVVCEVCGARYERQQ